MTYGPQVRGPGPWSVNSETPNCDREMLWRFILDWLLSLCLPLCIQLRFVNFYLKF